MPETPTRSPAQPAVVLGLTFLIIGLTFALPHTLIPQAQRQAMSEFFSPETTNVYACVAWAGWAHFLYAFRGQGNALIRIRDDFRSGRLIAYIVCVALTIVALLGLRRVGGATVFGAVVWVYFIDHFLKAEQSFEGKTFAPVPILIRWLTSYQPLFTFGWLSAILLNIGNIPSNPWVLWGVSLLLGAIVLVFGGWKKLVDGDVRSPLLSLFFVAEALVWGAFSQYGGPKFFIGVYVFHIAAGSYFHYLGSYFVANARAKSKDVFLKPLSILAVNITIIAIGYVVVHYESLHWLSPIFGIHWFTLWVAVHLVSSDLFPSIKAWRLSSLR